MTNANTYRETVAARDVNPEHSFRIDLEVEVTTRCNGINRRVMV